MKSLCSECHIVVPEIVETLIAECLSPIDVLEKVEIKSTIVPLHEKHIRKQCRPLPINLFTKLNSEYFLNKRDYTPADIENWITGFEAACSANPSRCDEWYTFRNQGLEGW